MVSFEDTSVAFKAKSNIELRKTYFLFAAMNSNVLVNFGTNLIKLGLAIGMPIKTIVRSTLFKQFCGGETIEKSESVITQLNKFGIGTVLHYSVEGEKSEKGFDFTTREILGTIEKAGVSKAIPFTVFKVTGIASADLLEKVQKMEELSEDEEISFSRVKERINLLCKAAADNDVHIFIDAEESWIQDVIDDLAYQMMKVYNKQKAIVFNTFQLYRSDVLANLKKAHLEATSEAYFLGAKLVRGAYLEKERERAAELNYVSPVQASKDATDKDYDEALRFCINHLENISFCAGTHNEISCYLLISLMKRHNILNNDERIYFAQLYGMSDHISYNLSAAGYNVAKYLPYGPVEAVMPYLFRRANENTAIAGQSSREFALVKRELQRRKESKRSS